MSSKVQIQIVTHNSKQHLESLLRGLAKQQGVDCSVLVIDNASTDGTLEWLADRKGSLGMTIKIIANQDNKGFAKAHNQGFAQCHAPYVLVLNPDVELQEGCLLEMTQAVESFGRIAAVAPKLYKILPFNGKSGIIDSLGIKMLAWGQVVNIGENKPENAKFEPTEAPHSTPLPRGEREVWGISGACALYRLSSLQSVKDEHGIYDERFWMYKEDADLAWRLNRAGFQSALAPGAIALHRRSVQKGDRATRQDRFKQESIKNHLLMLKKNLSLRDWRRLPFILVYECLKFVYTAIFETRNLNAYYGFIRRRS